MSALRRILTLRCAEADRLLSDAFERRLTLSERLALRAHVLACRACRRSRRQLLVLQATLRRYRERIEAGEAPETTSLSPEARERLRRLLGS